MNLKKAVKNSMKKELINNKTFSRYLNQHTSKATIKYISDRIGYALKWSWEHYDFKVNNEHLGEDNGQGGFFGTIIEFNLTDDPNKYKVAPESKRYINYDFSVKDIVATLITKNIDFEKVREYFKDHINSYLPLRKCVYDKDLCLLYNPLNEGGKNIRFSIDILSNEQAAKFKKDQEDTEESDS